MEEFKDYLEKEKENEDQSEILDGEEEKKDIPRFGGGTGTPM